MVRKVKEERLPAFPVPADIQATIKHLWPEEFRTELKKLNKVSQRAVDSYLMAFGLPTRKIPEKEAFFKMAEKKSVQELCAAHATAIKYTSATGVERARAFEQLDNMIGRMIEWKGKDESLSLCEFPQPGSDLMEIELEEKRLLLLKVSEHEHHIVGELAAVFPPSYFTNEKLKNRKNRLALARAISKEEWEIYEDGLHAQDPRSMIVYNERLGLFAKYTVLPHTRS